MSFLETVREIFTNQTSAAIFLLSTALTMHGFDVLRSCKLQIAWKPETIFMASIASSLVGIDAVMFSQNSAHLVQSIIYNTNL